MASKEEYTFRSTSLPQDCFRFFADLRNQKKLCDIEFTAGKQRISAHRVILIAAIPLFREALFEEEEIPVPDIDPNVLECLIDYSYRCELEITMVNVKGLLAGACLLRMKDVQKACCNFLSQRLNPENVLNFRGFAVDLNITHLKEITDSYIKENFEEVSKTEGFLHTPLTYVRDLIAKDDLKVSTEEKVLESVLRWVKASPKQRKNNLAELLKRVRMVLLKPLFLRNLVEREELIQTSLPLRNLIDEATDYNLFPERRKAFCSFSTKTRQFVNICKATEETGCAIYSLHGALKYSVLHLDLVKETWFTKLTKEFQIDDGCVEALNKTMYFFHDVYAIEYDPVNNEIRWYNPFATSKRLSAAASLRGKIFVCGGLIDDCIASSIVECFDPAVKICTMVNPLRTARYSLNAVSLGDNIFVIGGRDKRKVYDTVELYNCNTGKWQFTSSMLTPRFNSDAAVLNGRIYVCGGSTTVADCTETAEMYDPIINKWKLISPMNTARCELRLVAFCGKLYGLGGEDSQGKLLDSCEVYDPEADKWSYGPPVPSDHYSSAAVVM